MNVEVKIPAGANCKNCPAKSKYHKNYCRLYDVKLYSHEYKKSGARDPWGHNKKVSAIEKCEQCKKEDRYN